MYQGPEIYFIVSSILGIRSNARSTKSRASVRFGAELISRGTTQSDHSMLIFKARALSTITVCKKLVVYLKLVLAMYIARYCPLEQ